MKAIIFTALIVVMGIPALMLADGARGSREKPNLYDTNRRNVQEYRDLKHNYGNFNYGNYYFLDDDYYYYGEQPPAIDRDNNPPRSFYFDQMGQIQYTW